MQEHHLPKVSSEAIIHEDLEKQLPLVPRITLTRRVPHQNQLFDDL